MSAGKPLGPRRWFSLSLRQTLFLGAGMGILLPALVLAYFQVAGRFENDVNLHVRVPMRQYADVLARGVAVAIWNLDRGVASELVEAVMRNPDVFSVTVTDEYQNVFVHRQAPGISEGALLREERDVIYNGARIGHVDLALTSERVQREFRSDMLKLAGALLAQVGISFLLIWLLFDRRLVRPLRALQEGASRLARGELDQALRWDRRDEMGRLAAGLDKMRLDLGALLAERDQKNAALQHELAEHQRTEAALGFSQAKFAAIFDASPVAMTVSDMGGTFAALDLNAAWVELFGWERNAMLASRSDSDDMWCNPQDRRAVLKKLKQTGEISRSAVWLHRGSGLPDILCEISGKVISLGAQSLLILAYEDTTEKHRIEEEIRALNATLELRVDARTQELSDALERLTQAQAELVRSEKMSALGSLVAGVAHELNTPIGNSLMVASTMQDQSRAFATDMATGLTRSRLDVFVAQTQEGAGILMRGLRQAADLVSSFKQVAVDQTSVNRRHFNLQETVDEILLTLRPSIRKTGHTVHSLIPQDISMESYPGPLGQVLSNLMNNALLHGLEGRVHGTVTIGAELQGPGHVLLTVCDDGVGIAEANLARVFDPFFTTKLGRGGSGLGLNIVYNLVRDALGGRIEVDSTAGQGACFRLVLPLVAPLGNASV